MSELVLTAGMVPSMVVDLPSALYAVGVSELAPVVVALGDGTIKASCSSWGDVGVRAKMKLRLSLDGGLTWSPDPSGEREWPWGMFPVSWEMHGGQSTVLDEKEVAGWYELPLPDKDNPLRQVKPEIEAVGGTLSTAISFETL